MMQRYEMFLYPQNSDVRKLRIIDKESCDMKKGKIFLENKYRRMKKEKKFLRNT